MKATSWILNRRFKVRLSLLYRLGFVRRQDYEDLSAAFDGVVRICQHYADERIGNRLDREAKLNERIIAARGWN
jgi:hypothetical protein